MKMLSSFVILCSLFFCSNLANAQYDKEILIKSIESYVVLNHAHLYQLFLKEKLTTFDSTSVEVDAEYFCIKGLKKNTDNSKTILCLYEGTNNAMYDIVYGDLNNDGQVDVIVSFTLEGFAGGNGSGRFHAVLVGNKGSVAVSNVYYFYPAIGFDSITKGIIYGTQDGYDKDDGRCCPSLMRDVIYQIENNEFKLVKQLEYKKVNN